MRRRAKLLIGGAVVAAVISFLLYQGFRETLVYFLTPEELQAKGPSAYGEHLRLGGFVVEGTLKKGSRPLEISFQVTDGKATIPVSFVGVPPDLFGEGRGVVVEGKYTSQGVFQAVTILAKHSEEYRPPRGREMEVYKTLILEGKGDQR